VLQRFLAMLTARSDGPDIERSGWRRWIVRCKTDRSAGCGPQIFFSLARAQFFEYDVLYGARSENRYADRSASRYENRSENRSRAGFSLTSPPSGGLDLDVCAMHLPKTDDAGNGSDRLMTTAEMLALLASGDLKLMSKVEIFDLLPGHVTDPLFWSWLKFQGFPPSIELGPPGSRNTTQAWWRHEVLEWLRLRPRRVIGQGAYGYRGPVDDAGNPAPKPRDRKREHARRAAGELPPVRRGRGRPKKAADALAELALARADATSAAHVATGAR
jgi:predicted DNA-binding transcriptional regulator AlpA